MRGLRTFLKDESGVGSFFGFFLLFSMIMVGGYAVDIQNVMTARTRLQVTADATAHAALVARETMSAVDATATAVAMAAQNMPANRYGVTVAPEDIVFGRWDEATRSFVANANSRSAVQVTAYQTAMRGNSVQTYLLRVLGLDDWNVSTTSIFSTYRPSCLREGFVANGVVDLQSNNTYTNGFCIHSNSYVSLNSNNTFEPGTVVSMTDLDDLELPNSGYKTNIGLEQALREGSWHIRIVSRIDDIIARLEAFDPDYMPDYIDGTSFRTLPDNRVQDGEIDDGQAYRYSCGSGGNQTLTIDSNVRVRENVIITNCKISYSSGVELQDAVIVSKNLASNSHNASSGLIVGKDDDCAAGGGAQLVTLGGMDFAADLHIYGSQLLAVGDIEFAANANGIQGAAMVAGGVISGTSNMNMGFCGTGMEDNFHAAYFKLVQ